MPDKLGSVYDIIPQEFMRDPYYNPNKCCGVPIHPFVLGIIGGSRTGKSDTAITTILKCDNFGRIEIYAKNIMEPIYQWIQSWDVPDDVIMVTDDLDNLKPPEEFDHTIQTLIIVDDFVLDKKNKSVEEIAQRGMKQNISLIYISQSFYAIDKFIRQNFTYLILKSINSNDDLKEIIRHFSIGTDPKDLLAMYKDAVKKKTDFLLIELHAKESEKFRKNFDLVYNDGKWDKLPTSKLKDCGKLAVVKKSNKLNEIRNIKKIKDLEDKIKSKK